MEHSPKGHAQALGALRKIEREVYEAGGMAVLTRLETRILRGDSCEQIVAAIARMARPADA